MVYIANCATFDDRQPARTSTLYQLASPRLISVATTLTDAWVHEMKKTLLSAFEDDGDGGFFTWQTAGWREEDGELPRQMWELLDHGKVVGVLIITQWPFFEDQFSET